VAVFRSVSKVAVRVDIKVDRRTIEAENFAGLKDHSVDYFAVFIERKAGEPPLGFAEAYEAHGNLLGRPTVRGACDGIHLRLEVERDGRRRPFGERSPGRAGPHLVHIPPRNGGHERETATNENLVWPPEKL
jgi:hypothetical protein